MLWEVLPRFGCGFFFILDSDPRPMCLFLTKVIFKLLLKYVALHKRLAIVSDYNALHKMIMESYRSLCFIRQGIVCYPTEISVCWIYIFIL
jgi:hypothetical protein